MKPILCLSLLAFAAWGQDDPAVFRTTSQLVLLDVQVLQAKTKRSADGEFSDRGYVRDRRHGKVLQINDVYCASSIACGLRRHKDIFSWSISVRTFSACGMKNGTTLLERFFKKV